MFLFQINTNYCKGFFMKTQKLKVKKVINWLLALSVLSLLGTHVFAATPKKFLQRYSCKVDKKMENHQWRPLRKKGQLYSEKISNSESRIVLKDDRHKLEMTVPFTGRAGFGPINVVKNSSKLKFATINHKLVGEVESQNKKYRVSCTE